MHLNIKFALKDWLATIIFMFGINKKVEKVILKNGKACWRVSKCQWHKIKFMVTSIKLERA